MTGFYMRATLAFNGLTFYLMLMVLLYYRKHLKTFNFSCVVESATDWPFTINKKIQTFAEIKRFSDNFRGIKGNTEKK